MNIAVEESGNHVIINLEGEMMLGYEAKEFHDAVRNALDNNRKEIVVDLSNVKFISSWGIGILIYGYTTAVSAGGKFKLASVPRNINDVLKKVKLDNIFSTYDSIEEALGFN